MQFAISARCVSNMSIQATFTNLKGRINDLAEEKIEEKLEDLADYTVRISPVDTGAYVNSFSIKRSGQGGGRRKTPDNKDPASDPEAERADSKKELLLDVKALNISDMLEQGDVRFTLRNRSPHAIDVENGANWSSSGYHVFARIRNKFG
jgi:hypothetical protein